MTTKHVPHRFAKDQKVVLDQIGSYMIAPVLSILQDASVKEAAQFMHEKSIGSLLVMENEEYVGIMTERDLSRKIIAEGLDPEVTKVSRIMTAPVLSMDASSDVMDANKFMAKNRIRHLAVTEDGKIVGMLSVRDLVSFYSNPRLR